MTDPLPFGPAVAKRLWETMRIPSTRRVARKLRQAGTSVSHMTVARWRNRGWRPLEREQHPLEVAREQLDDAVPLLTVDAMTTAKVFHAIMRTGSVTGAANYQSSRSSGFSCLKMSRCFFNTAIRSATLSASF